MTKVNRSVPKRRFKEFQNADDWEQRKLGEVVYRSSMTSSSKTLPRLEFEDINSGLGTLNKNIYQKTDDERKGLEFNNGDVLFGKLRPYLKNWWFAEYKGIALGDFWNLKSDIWHNRFLYSYIQSNAFQVVANDTSGTKMPRSDWNLVSDSIAIFPSLPEQKKIGTFFSVLDRLITLHQRKLDKLKNVKKAYLSELFPAEGEREPKRRFSGFTAPWEKHKVEKLGDFYNGNGLNWNDISENGTQECILYGNLYTDYGMITDSVIYKTNTKLKKPVYSVFGDVLIPASDTTPTGLARATSIEKEGVLLGGDINIIRPKNEINGSFLSLCLNVNKDKMLRIIKGTTVRHIHNSDIKEIEIYISQIEKEQFMLVELFKNIDRQIALHQRKLDKLKDMKKAYLNELFV